MEPTVSAILAAGAVGGFAVTAITCWLLIPALHRLHFGQTIREEGPTWHNKKNGTPTMGGLGFIFGILLTIGVVRSSCRQDWDTNSCLRLSVYPRLYKTR